MKNKILYSSCSELIFRISTDTSKIEEIEKDLKTIGINCKDNELTDIDNPELNQVSIELRNKDNGYNVNGVYIQASQHCQPQLFQTMKKIEEHFKDEWTGQDGGSTFNYDEWKDELQNEEKSQSKTTPSSVK